MMLRFCSLMLSIAEANEDPRNLHRKYLVFVEAARSLAGPAQRCVTYCARRLSGGRLVR